MAVLAWIYGVDRFIGDIQTMLQWRQGSKHERFFFRYWRIMWRYS